MKRHLMIGLPGSGKTTFLAALWSLLNAADVRTALTLRRYAGDRRRLEKLANLWLAGGEMGRTKLQQEGWVELILGPADDGPETILHLPDLSGEGFEGQWRDRRCAVDYMKAAREADGVLLFIHPVEFLMPSNLSDLKAQAEALAGPEGSATPVADKPPKDDTKPKPYDPDQAPTQLMLVDLLQILCAASTHHRQRRLAVVLSAWDLVSQLERTPSRYLADQMPMLYQYVRSNEELFETRVYGVSCQGMDQEDAGYQASVGLLPQNRIIVTDGVTEDHDLTALLHWTGGYG